MTVVQSRTAGQGALYEGVNSDFVTAAAGSQKGWGTTGGGTQGNGYTVTNTSSVLTLNQRTANRMAASQTISFTFADGSGQPAVPKSVMFNIYDVTSVVTGSRNPNYYSDTFTLSGGSWVSSAFTGYTRGQYATVSSTAISMTGKDTPSINSGSYLTVTISPTSNSFSLTYSNTGAAATLTNGANNQYVGIGDLTVCF